VSAFFHTKGPTLDEQTIQSKLRLGTATAALFFVTALVWFVAALLSPHGTDWFRFVIAGLWMVGGGLMTADVVRRRRRLREVHE
jgi:hypothetical protein